MAQTCGTSQRPSAPKEEGSSSFTGQRTALPRPRCPCRGGHGPTACHPATAGLRTARSGDSLPPALRSLSARQQPPGAFAPHWAALGCSEPRGEDSASPSGPGARLPRWRFWHFRARDSAGGRAGHARCAPAPRAGRGPLPRLPANAQVTSTSARTTREGRCRCGSHGCPRPCLSPLSRKSL